MTWHSMALHSFYLQWHLLCVCFQVSSDFTAVIFGGEWVPGCFGALVERMWQWYGYYCWPDCTDAPPPPPVNCWRVLYICLSHRSVVGWVWLHAIT